MKKVAITMMMCIVVLCTAMAQEEGPMTPRAAIANCEMVNPQAHIANDYNTPEAFIEHNSMLNQRVMKWANEQMKNIDMDFDPVKAQKESDRKLDKAMRQAQQFDPRQQMEAIQRMMEDMKTYYKLSDKEIEKLADMSDKQGNAFLAKRAEQLGVEYKVFDPSQYGVQGVRDEEAEALATKRQQVQKRTAELEKKVQAFFDRKKIVNDKIAEIAKIAEDTCKVEVAKWYKQYESIPTGGGPGGIKNPEAVERLRQKAADALIRFEQKVYIIPVRELLIGLLDYAETADEANAECLRLWLSVTDDAMARQGLMQKYNHTGMRYAVAVYGLYDNATTEYCKFIPKRGWDH